MNKLRKSLVVSVMVLTVLATSGVFNISAVNASASAGDLIKMSGNAAVYYLGADGKRYVFPNSTTFNSWYNDFSGVVTIPQTELQGYLLGGNVTMRAGTQMVKITTDPSVYAVEPNGVLRKITSEAQASALYGTNWNKKIVDVADSYFTNYTIGTALANGEIPVGSLVKNAGSTAIYYYDGTNYRSVANETALTANRFNMANVLVLSNTIIGGGSAITAAETALVKTSQGATAGTGTVITGSGLMVSLNSTTAAAMNVPAGSAVEFLKVNLTAANDGAINVSSIKLTAYGLSAAANIDNVTFYDNGVKVGTAKNINSDRVALFNFATPIAVAAGTTKTLTVKANIVAATTGNYGLGIAAASDVTCSGATVSGSFPVTGNIMSSVISTVGALTITDSSVTANASFGEDNVLLADFTIAADNTEDALVQSISLYNGGTNTNDIVSNLKLFIDGEEKAAGTYVDRYATFNLNNYVIAKGDSISVEVRGDMGITNVTDTVKLYLKDGADLMAMGKTHGFNLSVVNSFDTINSVISLVAGDFTIDVDKSATPAKDVKPEDKKVVLATLTLKSNGENATINSITGTGVATHGFKIENTSTSSFQVENVEMVDLATGGVYDLSVASSANPITQHNLTMSDEITLVKGVAKKFAIRADILSTVPENSTFKVTLESGALSVTGDTSDAAIINITPSSISGSIITVKKASLTLTPITLNNINVVGGASDVVVYQAKVKAGTADGVKIQSLKLTAASSSLLYAFNDSNITKLDLYLNGKLLRSVANQIDENGQTITFNSLNSANYTVAAGAEVDLEVKATFASTVTGGDFKLSVDANADVTARSFVGGDTITASTANTDSRIVTAVTVGTLKVELIKTDSKADQDSWVLAGAETAADRYLGELKFTTTNEAVKVTKLVLNATSSASATNADLRSVKLYKMVSGVPTLVGTATVDSTGDATFDPFDVTFAADQVTSLFISVVAKGMNIENDPLSTATFNRFAKFNIDSVTAKGDSSGTDISMVAVGTIGGAVTAGKFSDSSIATNGAYIVGSKMNSVVNSLSDGNLVGGVDKIIGKYTLAFDNGDNRTAANEALKAILATTTITITKTSAVSVADVKMYIDGSAANVAAGTIATSTGDTVGTSTSAATFTAAQLALMADSGKLDGTVTLVITATVGTTAAVGEYVQTSFADLSGTGGDDDIFYYGNGLSQASGGVGLTNMFLPVISVTGGTLSEN